MSMDNVWILNDGSQVDLRVPSDISDVMATLPIVSWAPRSAKIDTAVVLREALDILTLTKDKVAVIATGAFKPGMMRDPEFNQRSVIVIARAGDAAKREALGELIDIYTREQVEGHTAEGVTPSVQDPKGELSQMGEFDTLVMKGQVSNVAIEIFIFDENAQRLEQLYLVVKTLMFASEKTFLEELGYTEVLRLNGVDNASFETSGSGGVFVLESRTLTYQMQHRDFLAGIEGLAQLISETYTVTSPIDNSATPASESADIGDGGR